jgi:hypothetical protein
MCSTDRIGPLIKCWRIVPWWLITVAVTSHRGQPFDADTQTLRGRLGGRMKWVS